MDLDYSMDDGTTLPLTGSQWVARASASTVSIDADIVRWQSSEPQNPALQALMKAAETSVYLPPRSSTSSSLRIESEVSELGKYDATSDLRSSTSGSSSSRPRSSMARRRPSNSSRLSSPATPLSPSIQGHTAHFLDLIKTVSGRIDENERLKRQRSARQQQPLQKPGLTDITSRRNVRSNHSMSCVQTAPENKGKIPATGRWSLPNLDTPTCEMRNKNELAMDVDAPVAIDIHVDSEQIPKDSEPSSLAAPVHSKAAKDHSALRPETRSRLSSPASGGRGQTVAPSLPPQKRQAPSQPYPSQRSPPASPRLHPTLSQEAPRNTQMPSSQMSQRSFRPPVLGMRRAVNSTPVSAFSASQNIPYRQKGFKPPLAKKPSVANITHNTVTTSSSSTPENTRTHKRKTCEFDDSLASLPTPDLTPVQRSATVTTQSDSVAEPHDRSPSPFTEADSSFGDISFDMDALEETMQKYD
ncbi:hypothetical protein SERLADRAFT_453142 [Serpula lacrymans var. lacrymans S7.9]|uniref:Uncharacterized protein n=1 Tax=Serpula lacrymans var. lacrymans (strain S7.9) TaxID=578457 RepID=F8PAH6_SERL9|nr:uncharacterized protein SERLADRAFT_453142 [Serpula lacrymans var. lacrymans S7.9]EGO19815.1 hypothetical protein SERLADRAFT_453142 [Serpula lacrymans var. lacrymans S7.9]